MTKQKVRVIIFLIINNKYITELNFVLILLCILF